MTDRTSPYLPAELARVAVSDTNTGFFAAHRSGGLAIQTCAQCGMLQHPPRELCIRCHASELTWTRLSGRGRVYTYTIAHHPVGPLKESVPYNVVSVALEEAPDIRIISNVVDVPADEIRVDMPVSVLWEAVTEDIHLPRFRREPES